MIKFVNYNKGAAIIALRNTHIISMLYMFLAPSIFYILDKYLFKLPEHISDYIIIMLIATGIMMYIISSVVFLIFILNYKLIYTLPKKET